MKFHWRTLFLAVLVITLLAALPSTASANKKLYKARLSTDAELHEVVGSSARGNFNLAATPTGYQFFLNVNGLSGPVTAAHIHGPATESEAAGVLTTLCGGPAPAATTCEVVDGRLSISGELAGLQGISGAEFAALLDSGMTYVNVHTAQNPAGETRGQLYLQ